MEASGNRFEDIGENVQVCFQVHTVITGEF